MTQSAILRPFVRGEGVSTNDAMKMAGKSRQTVVNWAMHRHIGWKVGGQWCISRVALAMVLEGNEGALSAYLTGDRQTPLVRDYFTRCGLRLPPIEDAETKTPKTPTTPTHGPWRVSVVGRS